MAALVDSRDVSGHGRPGPRIAESGHSLTQKIALEMLRWRDGGDQANR
jgi:hypothetical protein